MGSVKRLGGRPGDRQPAKCRAPRAAHLVLTWGISAPSGARGCAAGNPAPERRSAPVCPTPDRHPRRDVPSPRAEPTVTERATLPSGARFLGVDRIASARLDYLQMRQQSLAEMALQEGRVVIRQQESRDRRDWGLRR